MPTPALEWLPVPDAATAAGVPARSLYRWIEKKRVPTRQQDGVTVVQVADVQAYVARREARKTRGTGAGHCDSSARTMPTIQPVRGGDAGRDNARGIESPVGSGTPLTITRQAPTASGSAGSATDADLAAEVFGRFEDGDTPVDVVQEMRLSPERVRALHREWMELRTLGGGGGPSVSERVAALEDRLRGLEESLSAQMSGADSIALDALGRVQALEQRLAAMPLLSAKDFTCPACRSHGLLDGLAACGHCRTTITFGPRQ